MSPLGTTGTLLNKHRQLPFQEQLGKYKRKQGRFVYGVEAEIRDEKVSADKSNLTTTSRQHH